jgi:hypothetical protein
MARRNEVPAPPEVRRVRDGFEQWRGSKHARERIPERLWRFAVTLCRTHSANRVARWLRLNDTALRERIRRSGGPMPERRRRTRSGPRFVELVPTAPMQTGAAEYVIKVDGVRVRVRGAAVAEVAALARALRGAGGGGAGEAR